MSILQKPEIDPKVALNLMMDIREKIQAIHGHSESSL